MGLVVCGRVSNRNVAMRNNNAWACRMCYKGVIVYISMATLKSRIGFVSEIVPIALIFMTSLVV